MALTAITELFAGIQIEAIKRKHPIVVAYYRHVQKPTTNGQAEVDSFTRWLQSNPHVADKRLDNPYFSAPSHSICFQHVLNFGTPETIDWFWKRLIALDSLLFPDGRPAGGAASALGILETNPMFSDVLDDVKSTIASLDPSDPTSVMSSEAFGKLVKNIRSGLESGKYSMSDISRTVTAVIESVESELDPDMKEIISLAISMMSAAERGENPKVEKLLDMMKNLNFGK